MPPVYTPNTVQAELVYSLHSQVVENTLSFEGASTPAAADMQELATALAAWWTSGVAPYVSGELGLTRVDIRGLEASASASYSHPILPVSTGTINDHALPGNCALCVSFRTALSGRSFRGRNYVPGITEGNTSGSTIAAANANGIALAYNNLQTYLNTNIFGLAWTWVVVSTRSGNADRASGVTTPVTSAILVDYVVDSQRRRLPGRGR
jgi:hypothetical protein